MKTRSILRTKHLSALAIQTVARFWLVAAGIGVNACAPHAVQTPPAQPVPLTSPSAPVAAPAAPTATSVSSGSSSETARDTPCSRDQKGTGHTGEEFVAVAIDSVSKKPVRSARIILAPKGSGKREFTIDICLTAVSSEQGEVRIPNVNAGEYVVLYNLTASLGPSLQGKVVNWDTEGWEGLQAGFANLWAIRRSLGSLMGPKGNTFKTVNGKVIMDGYIFSKDDDVAMISSGGELLTLRVPSSGNTPVKIEINTDLPKK